jgi:hypothetical protein
VRAGPSPLKSILVGSTLVDRLAAVPVFPFIAGPAEGTLRACGGKSAFIQAGFSVVPQFEILPHLPIGRERPYLGHGFLDLHHHHDY